MYIKKLAIKNIRTLGNVEIELDNGSNDQGWVMIFGDNGVGKSTLLRSIALGLCDEMGAAGLLRELPGDLRKDKNDKVKITIELIENETSYTVDTEIEGKLKNTEKIKRKYFINGNECKIDDEQFLRNIFMCGYGAGRGADGTEDYLEYSIVDAVYTLFRYDQPLQNPELGLRRLIQKLEAKGVEENKAEKNVMNWIQPHLKRILLLEEEDEIILEPNGLWVKTQRWGKVNLVALGDGYKSTLNWILDLISWATLIMVDFDIKHTENINEINGIVLIDEIEQHLHPKWQRNIVSVLKKTFPKIQFIVTTHSPLIASNVRFGKFIHLEISDNGKLIYNLVDAKKFLDLNSDQVLASGIFDYTMDINTELDEILMQASKLAEKTDKTPEDKKMFDEVKSIMSEIMFPKGKTRIVQFVESEYYKNLQSEAVRIKKILLGKSDD